MQSSRHTLTSRSGLAGLVLGLVVGCASTPAPVAPPERSAAPARRPAKVAAPFVLAGEALDAEVTVRGIAVAQGHVEVLASSEPDELRIEAHGTGSIPLIHPALMTSDTWLGTIAGYPSRYLTSTELGSKKRTHDVHLLQPGVTPESRRPVSKGIWRCFRTRSTGGAARGSVK